MRRSTRSKGVAATTRRAPRSNAATFSLTVRAPTLNALTLHLSNLFAGRASVLLVSEQADPVFRRRGFDGLPTSTSVTRAANRSNVSIYVFDPRDAATRAANPDEGPNLLRVLADDTDGALFSGPETADAGLHGLLADAASYHLLSYRSTRNRDGLF